MLGLARSTGEPVYLGSGLKHVGLHERSGRRCQLCLRLIDQLTGRAELAATGQQLRFGQPREAGQVRGGFGPQFVDQLLCLIQAPLLVQDLGELEGEDFEVSPVSAWPGMPHTLPARSARLRRGLR